MSVDPVRVTVGVAYEDGVLTVGFAEEVGSGALLFSRSDRIDKQDSILGMDTYAISTQDGATVYGGVESATLNGTSLELQLTAETAAVLGLSESLVLRFEDPAQAESLGLDYAASVLLPLSPRAKAVDCASAHE